MAVRLLGIGDAVADHYLDQDMLYPGGCAYNFAVFAAKLGARSAFLGILGDDYAAAQILGLAKDLGVDTSRCRVCHGETPMPPVRMQDEQQFFVDDAPREDVGEIVAAPLLLTELDLGYIKGFDLMHTSIFSATDVHLEALANTGVPISFDFHDQWSPVFLRAHSHRLAFAEFSCRALTEDETRERIAKAHECGVPNVIATLGEGGAFFSDGRDMYFQRAETVEATDTMGAGDSFITAFLASYLADHDPTNALAAAAAFAATTVQLDGSSGHGVPYIHVGPGGVAATEWKSE